jgi:serine/threonine protein kinase
MTQMTTTTLPISEAAHVTGKYAPLARLATGGMAEILLARLEGAQGFEKLVVLKRLLPHLAKDQRHVSMFLDEARTVARISHPNVCQVYELGEELGHYVIVMEYLEGVTFGRVTAALPPVKGQFELRLCAELARQACEGLHHAHELRSLDGTPAGLVHRDVSPQNLLVTVDGLIKVLDFGIAKTSWSTTPTRAGMVLGKIAYMSPEQVRGLRVDRRSDLYSLGVVLHELIVRRWLHRRETEFLTYRAITEQDAPDVRDYQPDLPAALAEVLRAVLSRDASQRPASARELGERIVAAVAPLGGPLRPSEVAEWMAAQFGAELHERRDRVVDAVQRRAQAARRLASYADNGFDDLPTMQFDTEVDPSHVAPAPPVKGLPPRVLPLPPPAVTRALRVPEESGRPVEPIAADPSLPNPVSEVTVLPPLVSPVTARETLVDPRSAPVQVHPGWSLRAWLLLFTIAAAAALALIWYPTGLPSVAWPSGGAGKPNDGVEIANAAPAPAHGPPTPRVASLVIHGGDAADAVAQAVVEPLEPADAAPPPAVIEADSKTTVEVDEDASEDASANGNANATPHAPRDRRPGWLTIDSKPYATIFVDGKNVGPTPVLRLALTPGSHRVKAVTADGRQQRFRISIQPGREASRRRLLW